MKKKLTVFLACAALLTVGSGTMWGQAYSNGYVTGDGGVAPRRGHSPGVIDTIKRAPDVKNEYGAGESVTIISNRLSATPNGTGTLDGAYDSSTPTTNPINIQIGSDYSKNIVVNSYNAEGFAAGWINMWIHHPDTVHYNGSSVSNIYGDYNSCPSWDATAAGDHGLWNKDFFVGYKKDNLQPLLKSEYVVNGKPGTNTSDNVLFNGSWETENTINLFYWHHVWVQSTPVATYNSYAGQGGQALYNYINNLGGTKAKPELATTNKLSSDLPYTTTYNSNDPSLSVTDIPYKRSIVDDGIPLIQVNGDSIRDKAANDDFQTSHATDPDYLPKTNSNKLEQYRRPTTLAMGGTNTVNGIRFRPLNWYYRTYKTTGANGSVAKKVGNSYTGSLSNTRNTNVGSKLYPTTLNSFSYTANVSDYVVWPCCHNDTIRTFVTSIADWQRGDSLGRTLLDAALQLIDSARICVNGSVEDETGYIASTFSSDSAIANRKETNALIVWPVTDRVTLRTRNNFKANMAHEPDSTTTRNVAYTFPDFPDPYKNIYLTPRVTSAHPYDNTPTLLGFSNANATPSTTPAPANSADASLFGVFGDYQFTGNMADIWTDTVIGGFGVNNPGVIEVGKLTAGKGHFHIFSGGVLKNYQDCYLNTNFAMNFGQGKGDMPQLVLAEDQPLYILNYGNNGDGNTCEADLNFYAGAVDSVSNAFKGALKNGPMQIQALSDVTFNADLTVNNTIKTTGNNLYILSDAGNVVMNNKFKDSTDYVNATGSGTLTIWAEDRNIGTIGCNLFSVNSSNVGRGNVYMNDSAAIWRTSSSAGNTQTNIIAANNIRTAMVDFNSASAMSDTTNVYSEKGDVWLGYSINPVNTYDKNVFTYNITDPANAGKLNIKAGYDDMGGDTYGMGGNIYFSHINETLVPTGTYETEISIPYSTEWICGRTNDGSLHHRAGESMIRYEHSGIIGGLGRCGTENFYLNYAPKAAGLAGGTAHDTTLIFRGNKGNLLVDAGTRGNIIINQGAYLNFNEDDGNAIFTTRDGDIDMRYPFDVDSMAGSLLFYANSEEADKLITGVCGCKEERNNVYLQDFKYENSGNAGGSVFIGADNNIKLNYGGLQNMGTQGDPFLSKDYDATAGKIGTGYPCTGGLHCDMNEAENKARKLILNFNTDSAGANLTKAGGFAAVASDKIDVYKAMIYTGNLMGSGMSAAPTEDGLLHGENVAGYGLYMLTKADKNSYSTNILLNTPACPVTCSAEGCDVGMGGFAYLHNTVRMTFHDDARFYAGTQKIFLGSPVIEVFGDLALDTLSGGSVSNITIKTDSLILHDSLIVGGNDYKLIPWTPEALEEPVIKLGYKRSSPPFTEYKKGNAVLGGEICAPCVSHYKGKVYDTAHGEIPLDTMVVQFKNDGSMKRQKSMLADHTVLTFQTDSFDHVLLGGIRNAKLYVDTFKIRNQVEFWADAMHTRDAHFELISEEQMFSKDYAGMYTRHLHMEPIGPDCGRNTSELWLSDDRALDVITTSTFGGFGVLHADVHVENEGFLAPGFASLGLRGNCYEHHAGTLTMDDLRLDGGAIINVTVGDATPGPDGYLDMVDVQGALTTYGKVYIHLTKRPCQHVPNMCGAINPVLRYNADKLTPGSLNNIFLVVDMPDKNSKEYTEYKDDWDALANMTLNMTTEGEIYICEDEFAPVEKSREINMPSVAGVTTNPPAGIHYVMTGGNFNFTASYTTDKPYVVKTNRYFDGVQEVLEGKKNANGEYEYTISHVMTEPVEIYIGPEFVANASIEGNAVWSHNNTIYIKVDRADIASIYSVAGQLVKRVELSEGDTSIPAERGVYIITLKDGSVHKVIVK